MKGVPAPHTSPFIHPDYEVDRLLGAGGQAQVYLAHHRTLGRKVAIKVLRDNQDESMARRMLQEGRLIANLQHPNLVQVFDAGQTQDGRPYIVMEYVDGVQLRHWRTHQPLPIGDALELAWQVASGLAVAHEAGIVHRDVKPHNIVVETRTGVTGPRFSAKLLDFGVARPRESDETAVGMVIGTVGFMAPEVYDGNSTAASDIFSLGVVVHWLLSGLNGVRATEIRRRLTREAPDSLWSQHPELVSLVLGMVAHSPGDRPQSAVELVQQLDALRPWARFNHAPAPTETAVLPLRRRTSPALLAALVGGGVTVALGCVVLFASLHFASNRPSTATSTRTPIPPAKQPPSVDEVHSAPAASVPPTPTEGSAVAVPPVAAPPPAAPAASPPSRTASPATGSGSPPSETAPPQTAPSAASPDAEAAGSPSPAPTAPESTPEPAARPPTLAVGRYPGTIQGRSFDLEISGSPTALRAVLRLQLGARAETHTMTGTATHKSGSWHITAAESGGKWTLQGTLSGEHLQASVAIKGKDRGRIDTRRTQ